MLCSFVILSAVLQLAVIAQNHNIEPTTIPVRVIASSNIHGCPSHEEIQATKVEISNDIRDAVQTIHNEPNCGDGLWYRVAYLNMSDPSQQCPAAWMQATLDGKRVCARPTSTDGSCPGAVYSVGHLYSKVCGRVIGYQFGSTSVFEHTQGMTIDGAYVDGISITHGTPRTHIWTYGAGSSETGSFTISNCPCSNGAVAPPSYVGENYYCESAFTGDSYVRNRFFPDDPLWDGQQCEHEGTCCTGANTPPWFSVSLSGFTSDDIEVRICHNQDTVDEDTPIQLLELYVQ